MFAGRGLGGLVLSCWLFTVLTSTAWAQTWVGMVSVSATSNKATIRWTTAVPATSQIKYGTTTGYGKRNALDPALVTSHAMTLNWLTAGTIYHFRILTSDATGALVTSMDYSFVTASGPVTVAVAPATAAVAAGGTQQFSATVSNCGDTSVTWTASAGTVSASGLFTAPIVSADQTVTVTATSVSDPTKSASAVVTVKAPAPMLAVSPGNLTFVAQQGGSNPAAQGVSVANSGEGTLNFTATADAPWLTVAPASGSAPRTLQLATSIAGLVPGTYTGRVTVTFAGASGSPKTVAVTLTIAAPPVAHTVDLAWNASASASVVSYNAYRSTTRGGPYELIASAITGLAYCDRTVQPGVTYYYVVTANDDQANESGYSGEAMAAVPSP